MDVQFFNSDLVAFIGCLEKPTNAKVLRSIDLLGIARMPRGRAAGMKGALGGDVGGADSAPSEPCSRALRSWRRVGFTERVREYLAHAKKRIPHCTTETP